MDFFGPPNVEKMKRKRNIKGLIKALGYEKEIRIRRDAAEALGEIGDPRALEPLIAALRDKDKSLTLVAAEALGQIGDPRAIEPLISIFKDLIFENFSIDQDSSAQGFTANLNGIKENLQKLNGVSFFSVMPSEEASGITVFYAQDGKGNTCNLNDVKEGAIIFIMSGSLKWLKKDKKIWSRVINPKISHRTEYHWDGLENEIAGLNPHDLKVKVMPTYYEAMNTVNDLEFYLSELEEAWELCSAINKVLNNLGYKTG